ncbi:argonaut-like protein [Anaeramoeba ignava]|uniref:Argonaut-like protein n=1 Tax=Anaeramoeba ignava TaxID=1746090 RepID=A0A9Q0LS13_ANAIG|nr:argonaut-like protein [Anaeramoeba ignava]
MKNQKTTHGGYGKKQPTPKQNKKKQPKKIPEKPQEEKQPIDNQPKNNKKTEQKPNQGKNQGKNQQKNQGKKQGKKQQQQKQGQKKEQEQKQKQKSVSGWEHEGLVTFLGFLLLAYFVIAILIARYYLRGVYGLSDALWACNFLLPHAMWYIDLIAYFITGEFPIGSASYIVWPETPKLELFTTTHHLWFIPLCLTVISFKDKIRFKSWIFASLAMISITSISRFFLPKSVILDDGSTYVLNINMGHNFWDDTPIDFLHTFDNSPPLIYLTFLNFVGSFGFNLIGYLVTAPISHLLAPKLKKD